jgi:hypothetical protein
LIELERIERELIEQGAQHRILGSAWAGGRGGGEGDTWESRSR